MHSGVIGSFNPVLAGDSMPTMASMSQPVQSATTNGMQVQVMGIINTLIKEFSETKKIFILHLYLYPAGRSVLESLY
ncbi:hypothetical protein DPMN_179325 [Dreissena polymorpha]|uniref:Uncharacterized protein n=1 Tax=Dreissena polymorpha TaxID=45954 RepID=A0A9D4IM87_DREPO|nr:hypothetical protein DPMN_179325 [Dreissena polymorpha]